MGQGENAVVDYLTSNGGVITRAEAIALGIAPATLSRRVDNGYLVRVGHGIYAQPGVLGTEQTLLRAATRALGAVASHESAARLHGLDATRLRTVSVSVPVRRSNRFEGVTVHQLTDLSATETCEISSIPTTDPTRTIIDLASVVPKQILADLLDQSVRIRLTSYESVADRLENMARRGKPGVVKARQVLEIRLGGPAILDSTLETRFLDLLAASGLPIPTTQFQPPWLRRMSGRVDLAYLDEKLILEGDSRRWHGTPDAFQLDRQRDNLAQLAGWMILRFTWEDITKRSDYVIDMVAEALMKRRRAHI